MPLARLTLPACLLVCAFALAGVGRAPFAEPPLGAPLVAVTDGRQRAITLLDLSSGRRRTHSFGAEVHTVWGFSTDGCRLLYTLGTTAARLYSARLDGSDARPLVTYTELPDAAWRVWDVQPSPDGTRIAFVISRDVTFLSGAVSQTGDGREHRIAWIAADGGSPTFYSLSGDEHNPRWSPDGTWLAYTAYEVRDTMREADLWMIGADGAQKFRLTYFETGNVTQPRWSPDGQLIAFVYSPNGNSDLFYMIAADGGAIPTPLSSATALALDQTWLPDGTAVLAAARSVRGVAENRLWLVPLVGGLESAGGEYTPTVRYADYPRFSADGRWLAARSEYALTLIDTTSGAAEIVPDLDGNLPPVWTPAAYTGETACRTG